jgi:hypothetical protein
VLYRALGWSGDISWSLDVFNRSLRRNFYNFLIPSKKSTFPIFAGTGFNKPGSESGQRKNPESGSRNTGNK